MKIDKIINEMIQEKTDNDKFKKFKIRGTEIRNEMKKLINAIKDAKVNS